jgi:glycyl-tRNA synthetase beta subunit
MLTGPEHERSWQPSTTHVMQAAHVVPMPPVSECMRWQESVRDKFVRPMHSVLCTRKPNVSACLAVWSLGLFPSRRQAR